MKKLITIILAVYALNVHAQQVTDLSLDPNFRYTQQASIMGGDRLFISNSSNGAIYEYDLSTPNSILKEINLLGLEQDRISALHFQDEFAYFYFTDPSYFNYHKVVRRDASDFKSNEVTIVDDVNIVHTYINNNFLYTSDMVEIKRIDLNDISASELFISSDSDAEYIQNLTFFENKAYYSVYNTSDRTSTVYSSEILDPTNTIEHIATFDDASTSKILVTNDKIYFGNEFYDEVSERYYHTISEKDRLNQNTPLVELATGNGYVGSLFLYNNLLHFVANAGTYDDYTSKLSRIESTLSTPNEEELDAAFKITPNPNNGTFTLNGLDRNEIIKQVMVFDLAGREVYKSQENSVLDSETSLALNLSSGTYILELETANGVSRQKMVIR